MATTYSVGLKFETQLKPLQDAASELEKIDKTAKKFKDGFGAIKTAIATLGLGALAAGVVKVTSQFEQLELSLKAFTGSTEQAKQAYEAFKYVAVESPFDTMQVASAGKTLLAFGSSAKEAADMTRRLSMVAGATGADLGLMAMNLGQIRTLGRATTVDLKQMAMQGIPIYQELAVAMYGTASAASKVQQDIEAGKVSYETVRRAIENLTRAGSAYEQQAKDQLNSLQGLWATLQSAVQEVGNTIGKAFGDEIRQSLGKLIGFVEVLAGWLQKNAKTLAITAGSAVKFAVEVGKIAAAIWIVVKAYQAWQAISKAVAATQAFLIGLTGKGLVLVTAAGMAAAAAYAGINKVTGDVNKGIEDFQKQADAAGDKWTGLIDGLQGGKAPIQEMTDETEKLKQKAAQVKAEFDAAAQSMQAAFDSATLGVEKANARLSMEQALNGLLKDQLQAEYDRAQTTEQRFGIAVRIFEAEAQGAKIAYELAKAQNAEAVRSAELQLRKVELKYREVAAERALAAARGDAVEPYDQALAAQADVIDLANDQLKWAQQNKTIQDGIAAVQMQQTILAAEVALQTKLQSQEIGIAQQRAQALAAAYGAAAMAASDAAAAIAAANRTAGITPSSTVTGSMSINAGGKTVNRSFQGSPSTLTVHTALANERARNPNMNSEQQQDYLSRAMSSYGASGTPQVNVTYGGSVVQMDGQQYISKRDIPGLVSSAVNQTINTLGSSPNARRTAGIR